jgi:DNA-binding CsgD family transcriptional regulator
MLLVRLAAQARTLTPSGRGTLGTPTGMRRSCPSPSAALDTFSQLDAVPWAQRAGHELRATGFTSGTGFTVGHRADSGPGSLTPQQQREIVGLAGAGLTNKQIGERLFLSPHTVSTPFRLFAKLGVTSRAGLRDASPEAAERHDSDNYVIRWNRGWPVRC